MDAQHLGSDLERVLLTEAQIDQRLTALAAQIDEDYRDSNLLVVGVLRGAIMVVADLVRKLSLPVEMDWMACSSYGSGTQSRGALKILKDLDTDIEGRDVLIVEDILDTGLTLSWLKENLVSRGAKSVEILAFLRKPEMVKVPVEVRYLGFDVPKEFLVGYGLDYAQRYRNLKVVATLAPHVYRKSK